MYVYIYVSFFLMWLCPWLTNYEDSHLISLSEYTIIYSTSSLLIDIQVVVSDSVRPHRWQPTRLPHPWGSPGKNTEVGCHFLLQCMKVKSESEVAQSCPTLRDPMDCSPPGSSVHGTFQARVLDWGAIAFSVRQYNGIVLTF